LSKCENIVYKIVRFINVDHEYIDHPSYMN